MGKDSSIALIGFGMMSAAVILCAMIYAGLGPISPFHILILISVSGYSLIKGIRGLYKSKLEDEYPQKEREAAMILAWLPGLGQLYLGDFKKGIIPLILFVLAILCIAGDILYTPEPFLFIYSLIIYFYAALRSCIEVNEMCNQFRLEHTESPFEMKWENNILLMDILAIITYVFSLNHLWSHEIFRSRS